MPSASSTAQPPKDSRLGAFIERQLAHPSVEARRKLATKRKEMVREQRDEDDALLWGAEGKAGFRRFLLSHFGSVVAGWRHLDLDGNGRLSYCEFCTALRRIGFSGKMKRLWDELDDNKNGFVSIMEIDPEVGHAVGTFKLALLRKYGDMLTAWQKGLDVNDNGRIEALEVQNACESLNLDIDPKKLWEMLRCSPGKTLGLTLKDFDPEAYIRWVTTDYKGIMSKGNAEFVEDLPEFNDPERDSLDDLKVGFASGGARAWRTELTRRDVESVQAATRENVKMQSGVRTLDGFKDTLVRRCGSLFGAWRHWFDKDDNGRVTFGEFCQALDRLGITGDISGMWKKLDIMSRGYLLFCDFDEETDRTLTELRTKLIDTYGNMLLAWVKGLDTNANGKVDVEEFVAVCKKVGFTGNPRKLFRLLQPEAGRPYMQLRDLDTKADQAMSRGDFRMLSEQDSRQQAGGKSKLEMNINERTEASTTVQLARARALAQRSEYAKACRLADPHSKEQPGPEQFEHLCKRKYGSLASAWRLCLDADHNGRLNIQEFCNALRMLGYSGKFMDLWNRYDVDQNGYVSLYELDPKTDEMLNEFFDIIIDRFGDLEKAWKEGFHKDPARSIDFHDLEVMCKRYKCPLNGDIEGLFNALQPVFGSRAFGLWDIEGLFALRLRLRGKRSTADVADADNAQNRDDPTRKEANGLDGSLVDVNDSDAGSLGGNAAALSVCTTSVPAPAAPTSPSGVAEVTELSAGGLNPRRQKIAGTSLLASKSLPHECFVNTESIMTEITRGLIKLWGSTANAWRQSLDPHTKGFATRGNFLITMERICYRGNVKALWEMLTGDEEKFEFRDIDPVTQEQLETFRKQVVSTCGSIVAFWNQTGAPLLGGSLGFGNFIAALGELGISVPDPSGLFAMFYIRIGQRLIEQDDLRALLIGVTSSMERAELWGYDTEDGMKPPTPTRRELANQRLAAHREHDVKVDNAEGFKKVLTARHGSLFAAWRNIIDADRNGVATQKDFTKACHAMGFSSVKQLWKEIDVKDAGRIYLRDLDPEVADAFAEFERLLIERYGHTKDGWREAFGVEKTGFRCGERNFVLGCKKIGYPRDPVALFNMLRPETSRRFIYYEDMWENLNINDYERQKPGLIDYKSPLGRSASDGRLQGQVGGTDEDTGSLPPEFSWDDG
eukprot:TRINITY_DN21348_c0_g1_i1.p1 TRINITY_DN21348_c0_g1~~TRINITY_DN21348_c0_g1_i1.p1  ORF type:complete len:1222 (-),score=234.60 TRINITY_DN21348_c0_g1_i1:133-3660(-)